MKKTISIEELAEQEGNGVITIEDLAGEKAIRSAQQDWPHFRGPNMNGSIDISYKRETELMIVVKSSKGLHAYDINGEELWLTDIDSKTGWKDLEDDFNCPAVADNKIYVTAANKLYMLNLEGKLLGEKNFNTIGNISSPVIKNNLIAIASDSGAQLMDMSGKKIWYQDFIRNSDIGLKKSRDPDTFPLAPVISDDRIIIKNQITDYLLALDHSGKLLWKSNHKGPMMSDFYPYYPVIHKNRIFLPEYHGLVVVDQNGECDNDFNMIKKADYQLTPPLFINDQIISGYTIGNSIFGLV